MGDAELLTSQGWIECVGHADRACFDLKAHTKASGVKFEAEQWFETAKKVIGQKYKKESKVLLGYLNALSDDEAKGLDSKLDEAKEVEVKVEESEFVVGRDMFRVKMVSENVHSQKYVPTVVEPSFGIGRILYALLEHSIWERVDDEHRVVLSLKPRIAPYPVAVLPISNQLNGVAEEIESALSGGGDGEVCGEGIATWIDLSSTNIGRKYARC